MIYKILYVEDEPSLARIVSDGLSGNGYAVQTIEDGSQALTAFETFAPHLCLLDVMLPTVDGYELARSIRASDARVPILFLSARVLTEDIVTGFRSGGDDYLRKPFSLDELLIRIESLLRRTAGWQPPAGAVPDSDYPFSQCRLNVVRQTLTTPLGSYSLSFKETRLLTLLLDRRNAVLERQQALLSIWNDDSYYSGRSMDVFMSHLRKLLKDDPGIQLVSLRGVGYKLVC